MLIIVDRVGNNMETNAHYCVLVLSELKDWSHFNKKPSIKQQPTQTKTIKQRIKPVFCLIHLAQTWEVGILMAKKLQNASKHQCLTSPVAILSVNRHFCNGQTKWFLDLHCYGTSFSFKILAFDCDNNVEDDGFLGGDRKVVIFAGVVFVRVNVNVGKVKK